MGQTLKTEKSGHGIRVLYDQDHVKTIPGKFENVVKKKHIINPLRKRLTREERFRLEVALFERNLKIEQPMIYHLVKRSIPEFVRKVKTFHDHDYYELVYKNKISVKVHTEIYKLCTEKREINRNF